MQQALRIPRVDRWRRSCSRDLNGGLGKPPSGWSNNTVQG
jgi:hypothetical protein